MASIASSYGLEGVLLKKYEEEMKPVAYCSRTLADFEIHYAEMEKGCLAVVWTCERFPKL